MSSEIIHCPPSNDEGSSICSQVTQPSAHNSRQYLLPSGEIFFNYSTDIPLRTTSSSVSSHSFAPPETERATRKTLSTANQSWSTTAPMGSTDNGHGQLQENDQLTIAELTPTIIVKTEPDSSFPHESGTSTHVSYPETDFSSGWVVRTMGEMRSVSEQDSTSSPLLEVKKEPSLEITGDGTCNIIQKGAQMKVLSPKDIKRTAFTNGMVTTGQKLAAVIEKKSRPNSGRKTRTTNVMQNDLDDCCHDNSFQTDGKETCSAKHEEDRKINLDEIAVDGCHGEGRYGDGCHGKDVQDVKLECNSIIPIPDQIVTSTKESDFSNSVLESGHEDDGLPYERIIYFHGNSCHGSVGDENQGYEMEGNSEHSGNSIITNDLDRLEVEILKKPKKSKKGPSKEVKKQKLHTLSDLEMEQKEAVCYKIAHRQKLMAQVSLLYKKAADCEGMECTVCGEVFTSYHKRITHYPLHHKPAFTCEVCGKEFNKFKSIQMHIYTKDSCRNNISCKECEYVTISEKRMQRHMAKRHSGFCEVCGLKCCNEGALEKHMSCVHGLGDGLLRHVCDKCGKAFTSGGALKKHLNVHGGVKVLACTYPDCATRFYMKSQLKRHIRLSHEKVRNFQCPHGCGKSFLHNFMLRDHIFAKHTNLRNFQCTWEGCAKAFIRKSHLTVHMRIHTDEKKYKCEECGFSCVQKNSMNWHMKKHA